MKKILFLLLLTVNAIAQNITNVEYFIDNDPGYNLGTEVSLTAGSPLNLSFPVSLTGENEGFHFLTIRAKDENDKWGMPLVRPFYIAALSSSLIKPNIVKMEYFVDSDPGYGLATNVPITAGSSVDKNIAFTLPSNFPEGFHFFSIRAKDENSKWSQVLVRPFYIAALSSSLIKPNIVKMEYFVDSDPGYGLATNVPITSGSSVDKNIAVTLASNLPSGFHFFSIRAKDENGKWSQVLVRPFYIDRLPSNALPIITQLEYFIDNDPGYGVATAVSFSIGSEIQKTMMINLYSLSNGEHKIFIRAKDQNGNWSMVGLKSFTVQDDVVVATEVPEAWCKETVFNIPYEAGGSFAVDNVFTAQLSDENGSFSSPTVIGSINSSSSGIITATIPSGVSLGAGYLIRIISSNPVISNGSPYDFSILDECPPPCALSLNLTNPNDQITSGNSILEASANGGYIEAQNTITGVNTRSTYKAGAYILMKPGFFVDNGAVFQTEFGGCVE